MAEIINPHDKFFKEMLAQPEAARIFLRDFLPPAVAEQLDLSHLQLVKDSFGAWMGVRFAPAQLAVACGILCASKNMCCVDKWRQGTR
jgi:hypothetical protein